MNEHEEFIDKSNDDTQSQPVRVVPPGERGLSMAEVLETLIDGPPTEGDLRMMLELRVSLRADPSGPARVIDCTDTSAEDR